MAIDPTTPVTPIVPSVPAGTAPDSVALLQAMARQALTNSTAQLGEIVGRPSAGAPPRTGAPVEQAGQAATQDAGHAADAPAAKSAPNAQSAASIKPMPETRLVRAVRTAAAEAVPRQTGLAPLMADVRAVVERSDMPIEVREAGRALLAKTAPAAEIATPQGLRRAVERSGVFLEARMARAAAAPSPETTPRPVEANDMKAALLVFRGALSAWLARAAPQPLTGEPVPEQPARMEPEPEAKALAPPSAASQRQVSAQAAPQSAAPPQDERSVGSNPPQGVRDAQAPASPLSATAPSMSPSKPVPAEADAPKMVSEQQPDDEGLQARFGSFVAAPKSRPSGAQPVRTALSALVQLGLIAEEAIPEELGPPAEAKPLVARGYGAAPAEAARSKAPPPPYAGGPMAGQKPTAAELPVSLAPGDLVRRLLKGANGALARQDLMQIASLPEPQHHDPEVAEARPQGARVNLDLPFVTPQGVAVAQFEISHDGGGAGGGAVGPAERTYKVRFSIDVEPLGPVHALVTLTGARARVSLWAERAETIARLRAGEESLGASLRQAELTPEVAVHSGAPPIPGVSPLGHFVDQAS